MNPMAGVESVRQLDVILRPRSVAVIGASTAPGKLGHEVLRNIRDGGFQGPIYPINPKAESILNLTCYPLKSRKHLFQSEMTTGVA